MLGGWGDEIPHDFLYIAGGKINKRPNNRKTVEIFFNVIKILQPLPLLHRSQDSKILLQNVRIYSAVACIKNPLQEVNDANPATTIPSVDIKSVKPSVATC